MGSAYAITLAAVKTVQGEGDKDGQRAKASKDKHGCKEGGSRINGLCRVCGLQCVAIEQTTNKDRYHGSSHVL